MNKLLNTFEEFVNEEYAGNGNHIALGRRQGVVNWEDQERKTAQHVSKDIHDIRKNISVKFNLDSNTLSFNGDKILIDSKMSDSVFNSIKSYIKNTFNRECELKNSKV